MSPAEKLFFPILLFLTFLGYLHFFLCMLPGLGAALLQGYFNALVLFPRWAPKLPRRETAGYRGAFRSWGRRWGLAALAWDGTALALSIFLGRFNGWWISFTPKQRTWGGVLAALGYLLGRGLAALKQRTQ